jgi:hypothetical protein
MDNFLDKNIEILKKLNPTLAERINTAKNIPQITIHPGDNLNFILHRNNQQRLIYDEGETKEKLDSVIKNYLQPIQGMVSIIIGMGAGHLVKKICEKKEKKHIILVVEPEAYFLNESFKLYDFTNEIEHGELLFACPGEEEVYGVVGLIDSHAVINGWAILADPIAVKWPEKYNAILTYTIDIINQIQCNTGTVIGAGRLLAENDVKTFPYCVRHRGVNELQDFFKDQPAIFVSTGPSLQKNIHLLMDKKVQEKVIIIAIAQTLRILLAYDITPDFICTVDYGETNIDHFNNLWECNVPLIALNKTYSPILMKWKGSKFIVGSQLGNYPECVSKIISEKGVVDQGGSVSHMAFGCAVLMGCNPIIFIGQDLAFENNLSHNPNADASGKVRVEGDEILWDIDAPDSNLKGKTHTLGNLFMIDGYFGEDVKTSTGLLSFITSFEKLFSIHKDRTIINATEGGANIKGAIRMTLKSVIEKYLTKKINKGKLKPLLSLADDQDKIIDRAIDCLKNELQDYKDMVKYCSEGILWNQKMIHHFNNNKKKLIRDMQQNEIYSNKAQDIAKKNPTLNVAIYYASREIHAREFSLEKFKDEEATKETMVKQLIENRKDLQLRCDRNRLILEAAKLCSKQLIPMYQEALKLLEKFRETKDESLLTQSSEDNFKIEDSEKWFEKNNFAYPYLESKKILERRPLLTGESIDDVYDKAIEMRAESIAHAELIPDRSNDLEYLNLCEQAHELGKEKKYKDALKILKKAYELKTTHKNEKALWGIATAEFILERKEESRNAFTKLIKINPDNLKYKFEYGCIMLNDPKLSEQGLNYLKEVFEKTKEFDFFYKTIGEFLFKKNRFQESIQAYSEYLKSFADDISIKEKMNLCFEGMKNG